MTEQQIPQEAAAALRAAMVAYVDAVNAAMRPIVAEAARIAQAITEAARNAKQSQYALAPPPDRPAWQSPHGPAHTRRK
ncbi:hypothetical protein AB0M87_02550 [Streptomyces sp. NPDC051320]|uniref:hypothetical protein n=1 Tax=Streptomyces sp. NPDC051320 TaxID=3154644 RepID=UPI003417C9DA